MAKVPVATGGALIGWIDDEEGFVGGHLLRRRYNEACKDVQRAARAVDRCLNAKRKTVLQEEFEKVRRHLEDVEDEVRQSWRTSSTHRWSGSAGVDGADE